MTATRELLELQTIDVELGKRSARLTEIAPLLGDDATLRALAKQAKETQARLDDALSRQKGLDDVIADYTAKIDAAEAKLYGGAVRNPRELQDLQADVAMLNRHRGEHEDTLIAVLDEVEEVGQTRTLLAERLELSTAEWRASQQSMTEEQARLRSESADLDSRRSGVVSRIPPPEVALYERARAKHPGHPVARLHSGICDACRVGVPNRMMMEVRAGAQPSVCPNCSRVLLPE